MKWLATFGDSWPAGAELKDSNKRYGLLLQPRLECDEFWVNAVGGTSNEHMIQQLLEFVELKKDNDEAIGIFHLTNPARSLYWPSGMSWHDIQNNDFFKTTFLHFHESDWLRNNIAIMTLQCLCKHYGIQDYYFSGWVRYETWMPGIDTSKIYKQGKETAADWFGATSYNGEHMLDAGNNQYIKPNLTHPNELGHELIADKLEKWIKTGKQI